MKRQRFLLLPKHQRDPVQARLSESGCEGEPGPAQPPASPQLTSRDVVH